MAEKKTAIKKKPTAAVKSLGSMKVTKSGNLMKVTSSWKYPDSAFNDKKDDRFEGVIVRYQFDTNGVDNSVNTIKNNGKKNATISGVSGTHKDFVCKGKGATSKAWSNIKRNQYYPLKANDKRASAAVKVYTLTKNAVWNNKSNTWTIPSKGTSVKWMSAKTAKEKCKSWASLSKQAKTKRPKKGTSFYKSLTSSGEVRTLVSTKKAKTRVDGIAVMVQGWNSKTSSKSTHSLVKKPAKNPKNAGYYTYDSKKKKYVKTTHTTVKKGTKYYTRTVTQKFDSAVPKQIAYFNFKPPSNPSVSTTVGGQATNHNWTIKVKAAIDKSNVKERWDTHYESYYTYGMKKSYSQMSFRTSGANYIKDKSKNETKSEFTVNFNPNDYLKHARINSSGNKTNAYVTGLEEGEWLQLDFYYYDRGIAGPSVNTGKGTYQGADPTIAQMQHKSYLYAWPYDVTCNSPVREGQHYRIKFHVVESLAKNEKRRTGKYTLQRLANFRPDDENVERWTSRQWNTAAAASESWRDIYSIGGGEWEFSDNVRDAAFEPSHRTYYRVKSESQVDGIPHLYSDPVVVPGFAKLARAATDKAKIIEVSSHDDGRAMRVVVGFTRTSTQFILVQDPPSNPKAAGLWVRGSGKKSVVDGNADKTSYIPTNDTKPYNNVQYYEKMDKYPSLNSNGTEITWSPVKYAWNSSEQPGKIELLDEEKEPQDITVAVNGKTDGRGNLVQKPSISDSRKKDYPLWAKYAKNGILHFQTIYIRGLDVGVPYYFKARRFLKDTDTTVNDQYSSYATFSHNGNENCPVTLTSRPKKVKLSTDSVIERGSSVELSWTFDDLGWTSSEYLSTQPQEAYTVYLLTGNNLAAKSQGKVVSGFSNVTDSTTHATISYDKIRQYIFPMSSAKAERRGLLYFAVRVKVGGTWSDISNVVGVTFVTQPTSAVVLSTSTLLSLPLKATLVTNDPQASAIVRIVNVGGCATWMPYGKDWQADGSIIYSRKYVPKWSAPDSNGLCRAQWSSEGVELDLRDGGKYSFQFIASHEYGDETNVNRSFELYDKEYADALADNYTSAGMMKSAVTTPWSAPMNYDSDTDSYLFDSAEYDVNGIRVKTGSTFTVNWSRQPVPMPLYSGRSGYPAANCINPPILTSEGVQFTLPKTWKNDKGSMSTNDVIDMYRVTPDGAYLVKSDIEPGSTVIDTMPMYSNYANCRYRFATRTPEGDVDWVEVPSGMRGHCVRFDWGDEDAENNGGYSHLELPYNLKWTDQWTKNARVQLMLDGSYSAYWRGGVERKNSLSTELLKFEDPEQVERVRALATHSGPVYVRLPDGCAFCANVDVNSLENSYDSQTLTASFSAQEISMVSQYAENSIDIK